MLTAELCWVPPRQRSVVLGALKGAFFLSWEGGPSPSPGGSTLLNRFPPLLPLMFSNSFFIS